MLGDPKKLKTRRGHGFLVSWTDRLRAEGDRASSLVDELLADDENVAAIRAALRRPSASVEELAEWFQTGLASGGLALLRTRRRAPALRSPHEAEAHEQWERGRRGGAAEERPVENASTFVSVEVVDERGDRPVGGELRFSLNGAFSTHDASESVDRREIHPASSAGAGCLDLRFAESEPDGRPVSPPPETIPKDVVSFEVRTTDAQAVPVSYRLRRGESEISSAAERSGRVAVEGLEGAVELLLEL